MSNLIWQRSPQPADDYALVVVNRNAMDLPRLRVLLEAIKKSTGASDKRALRTSAVVAFESWLDDPGQPLPSHAYARLSNWFLTEKRNDRESALAGRCAEMWDELFVARPQKRLTLTDANADIVDITFQVWWMVQQERQGRNQ
jgi:hypothetical protein